MGSEIDFLTQAAYCWFVHCWIATNAGFALFWKKKKLNQLTSQTFVFYLHISIMFLRSVYKATSRVVSSSAVHQSFYVAVAKRSYCTPPPPADPTANLQDKIADTNPDLYHLEANEKVLGGKGIGTKDANMALVFECRVCQTQAIKQFSKQSYEEGVVLIECPGCKNKHVIADNLGWFFDMGENNNIEKQMKAEGQEVC